LNILNDDVVATTINKGALVHSNYAWSYV